MWGLRKGWRDLITSLLPGVLVTCNQAAHSRAGSAPICTHSAWCCLPGCHPQGDRHKGGRGDLQGWRPAHWHTLISEHTAQLLRTAHLPWAHRSGTPSVRPPANPQLGVYGEQALLEIHMSPTINPYRHWHACNIQERWRKECWGSAPLTPPHTAGLSAAHLPLPVDGPPMWAALLGSTTLGTTVQHTQCTTHYTEAHLPCTGAEPVLVPQHTLHRMLCKTSA